MGFFWVSVKKKGCGLEMLCGVGGVYRENKKEAGDLENMG